MLPAVVVHAEGHRSGGRAGRVRVTWDEGLDHSAAVGSRFRRVAAAAVVLPHRLLEHVRVDELLRVEPLAVRGFAPEALPGLSVVAEVPPRVRGGAVRAPWRAPPNHARPVGVVVAPALQRDASARALLRAPVRRRG